MIVSAQPRAEEPAVVAAETEVPFETRFFAGCPRRSRLAVHSSASAKDAHAVFYAAANLMELEVIRLADWLIDLPVLGREVRPIERTIDGIRGGYSRIAVNLPLRRLGELADALQLRELSLGDVASTYSGGPGATVSPGSGTLARVNGLVDWTQHVTGDVDRGLGRLVRRPNGLIAWSLPGRAVDRTQRGLIRVFHWANVTIARALDSGLSGVERGVEVVINLPRPAPHHRKTVFVRLPLEAYRAHERWVRRRRGRVYAGTVEELRGLSHAALFHGRRRAGRPAADWPEGTTHVVLVMHERAFARAPKGWAGHVIAASWIDSSGPSPQP